MTHLPSDDPPPPFWRSRFAAGWLVLAAVAAWFLWAEHRADLLGAVPYVILLACPLMHVFMHRGHHAHRGHRSTSDADSARPPDEKGGPT